MQEEACFAYSTAMILTVNRLKKAYGALEAVNEISFELKSGEILGLLGPNGSGKTTTIQMLLGTLTPTSGSIFYFGKDFVTTRSEALQHVSFASTYTSLPFILTVEENLNFFGRLYGIKNGIERAKSLLERFGIYDKRHERVSSLSAGQVTRLMLVKAFFTEPKVVLLDEPTASLDPDVSRDVCNFLLEQRKERGLSILFTSHKMEEVALCCDRVIVLKQGQIIADDLPKNLAKSTSLHRLSLTIVDGMKRTQSLATAAGIRFEVDNRVILFSLEERKIPPFLHQLMQHDISYVNIRIIEPTLEDYFIKIAEQS